MDDWESRHQACRWEAKHLDGLHLPDGILPSLASLATLDARAGQAYSVSSMDELSAHWVESLVGLGAKRYRETGDCRLQATALAVTDWGEMHWGETDWGETDWGETDWGEMHWGEMHQMRLPSTAYHRRRQRAPSMDVRRLRLCLHLRLHVAELPAEKPKR